MNEGAARACRADRVLSGRSSKVPRDLKRAWKEMNGKERGRLRKHWRAAQMMLAAAGMVRNREHVKPVPTASIDAGVV